MMDVDFLSVLAKPTVGTQGMSISTFCKFCFVVSNLQPFNGAPWLVGKKYDATQSGPPFLPSAPLIPLPAAEVLWPVSVLVAPRKWPLAEHPEMTCGRSSPVPFVWTSTRTPSYSSAATISAAFVSACTGTKMAMTTDTSALNAER